MLRFLLLACVLLVSGSAAWAQSNPTLTEAERGVRSEDAPTVHLRIEQLDVQAHLAGRTADVVVDMQIGSSGAESYEASVALTLPADAVVTGYALDVAGQMIPGQLLEAPKARNVYEDEVRSRIDPGLAEVSGNRFSTRIFPIDARQPRRFRLHFVAPFDPETGLVLPLARDQVIGRVTVAVDADGYGVAPNVRFAGQPLALSPAGTSWRGQANLGKALLREGLTVTGGVSVGPMLIVRHPTGQAFFLIADVAPSPQAPATRGGRLRIYWDRSLSHRSARTDLEADVVVRLAETTKPDAIDLVTFASDRPQVVTLPHADALRTALSGLIYRGGTSFAGLDALPLPAATRCVLVSDGTATIDRATTFSPDCPMVALTSADDADVARLERLTQQGRGGVIRLRPGGESEAVATLSAGGATPVSVRDAGGRRLDTRALPTGGGGWFLVGPQPEGEVVVRLSDGSERRYKQTSPEIPAAAPGALWAAARVAALADDPGMHKAMVDTARRYQIAGPGLSFLVLERPDQYLRAGLQPPEQFGSEWQADYRAAKKEWDAQAATASKERLSFVLAEWRERRAWWSKRFVPGPPKPAKRDRGVIPPPLMAIPSPMPPPAPAPAAANIAVEDDSAASVIVTGSRRQELPPVAEDRPVAAIKLDLADLVARRPYILALDAAAPSDRAAALMEQERQYGSLPVFYLDTAEWFRLKGDAETAALLLLSALELPTSDDETRQIVAFRLERDRAFGRAVEIAEQLAAANAEFRPQPGRDLALALAARGAAAGRAGRADLERAFQLLVDTALNPASDDFNGIEVIALMEANALIPLIEAAGGQWRLDQRLVGLTDTDVRIVIGWTADDADIDLWVDEPNGERVMYSNTISSAGGQISNDMTDGFGPEEYAIRRAPVGPYRVRVNGYDADRINPNGPGHVLIRLQRNFGRPNRMEELVDLDLSFQTGANRNHETQAKPIATLTVQRPTPIGK